MASTCIGVMIVCDHERWVWEPILHQTGETILMCHVEQMHLIRPAAWVVVLPMHMPPERSLATLPLNAPTLIITPWLAETKRLFSRMAYPLVIAHPDRARQSVRSYLTLVMHVSVGVVTISARRYGVAS